MENHEKDCVADASSLIALAKGEVIDCLGEFFRRVYIPEEVATECQDSETVAAIKKSFFEIRKAKNLLPVAVDKGELEAISLAVELGVSILLIEDKKAMRKALRYDLEILPLSNILVLIKQAGFIKSVRAVLNTMISKGEGIDEKKYFRILEKANEI